MTFIMLGLGPCKLHHQILLVGQEHQKSQQYIHFFGILYLSRPILVNKYYMHMLSIYFIFITQDTSVFPHEKKMRICMSIVGDSFLFCTKYIKTCKVKHGEQIRNQSMFSLLNGDMKLSDELHIVGKFSVSKKLTFKQEMLRQYRTDLFQI